jgi:uncharacterized protein (DUF2249 family)
MKIIILATCLFTTTLVFSQQVSDTLFTPVLAKPAYVKGAGPVVMIDEAHHNFHTAIGRFRPFAILLQRDGFQIKRGTIPFSAVQLKDVSILVISNALNARNNTDWTLPTPSAFTDDEIKTVQTWVEDGGSLFLIADHMPFPGCNEKLASAFGFTFTNGFAMKKKGNGPDLFCYANGRLQKNKLTEELDSIYSFTGQAFHIPQAAKPVLILDNKFENLLPREAWKFDRDTQKENASGMNQGAYLEFGKGKVFVSGEAAMFTAQIARGTNKMGFNHPDAKQNVNFLLNIMHWLASKS